MRPDKIPRLALGMTKAWVAKKKFQAIRKTENKKILNYKVQNFAAEDLLKDYSFRIIISKFSHLQIIKLL